MQRGRGEAWEPQVGRGRAVISNDPPVQNPASEVSSSKRAKDIASIIASQLANAIGGRRGGKMEVKLWEPRTFPQMFAKPRRHFLITIF